VRTSVAAFPSPILALRFVISCSASALPSIILLGSPIALLSDAVWCRTALVLVGRRFVKEGQAGRREARFASGLVLLLLLLLWVCACYLFVAFRPSVVCLTFLLWVCFKASFPLPDRQSVAC
jgi:low temperature requirement protein LtrA